MNHWILSLLAISATAFAATNPPSEAITATTGPEVRYVMTTGSNGNPCTFPNKPCVSPQGALDTIPKFVKHPVIINIAPGIFNSGVGEITSIFSTASADGAYVWLKGTCVPGSIATGPTNGTATGSTVGTFPTNATITDSGATWTVGNLRKHFACIGTFDFTTNTCSLGTWPIVDNTATSFTIAAGTPPSNNRGSLLPPGLGGAIDYRIQDPGSVFTGRIANFAAAGNPVPLTAQGISLTVLGDYQLGINTLNTPNDEQHVFATCIEFRPGALTRSVRVGAGSGIVLSNVWLTISTGTGVSVQGDGGRFIVVRSSCTGSGAGVESCLQTTSRVAPGYLIGSSNYVENASSIWDLNGPTQRMESVRNFGRSMRSRTYYHSGIFDGYIGGDTAIDNNTVDFLYFGNRSLSHGASSSVAIDGVNWSGNGTSQCVIDASNSKLDFDESSVASTGTSPNRNAAICLGDGSVVHLRNNTFGITGTLSGNPITANYGFGSVLKSLADIIAAPAGSLCNQYSGHDGCIYTP